MYKWWYMTHSVLGAVALSRGTISPEFKSDEDALNWLVSRGERVVSVFPVPVETGMAPYFSVVTEPIAKAKPMECPKCKEREEERLKDEERKVFAKNPRHRGFLAHRR